MSDKERSEYLVGLEKLRKKVVKDPAAAKKFLMDAGIITPKGNLKSHIKTYVFNKAWPDLRISWL